MKQFPEAYGYERARAIDHPNQVIDRERYDRVGAAVAVEPRDPFLDRDLVNLALRLPGHQKLCNGWPKMILRRAMVNKLPDAVLWRLGKQHLGWTFTNELAASTDWNYLKERVHLESQIDPFTRTAPYGSTQHKQNSSYVRGLTDDAWSGLHLAIWLDHHQNRQQMATAAGSRQQQASQSAKIIISLQIPIMGSTFRHSYRSPALSVYGSLSDLTAAITTAAQTEKGDSTQNPTKQRA